MMKFHGTIPALVTPFKNDKVDEAGLRQLVDFVITGGVSGVVPCGTTGESVALSDAEHQEVVRIVVSETRGRVPVIAGIGTASTHHTIHLGQNAKAAGCDAFLIVTPYYNRPTQEGLVAHYRAVLSAVPMPTVLYNIPGRTGVDVQLSTLEQLSDVKELVAIKEATGNVLRSVQILARFGDRFAVMSGDDSLTLPIMSVGGTGVISVTANVLPTETSNVTSLALAGKWDEARRAHLRLMPVHESMFIESNPGPVKAVLAERGMIAKEVRGPLIWPKPETIAAVCKAVAM